MQIILTFVLSHFLKQNTSEALWVGQNQLKGYAFNTW